MIARMSQREKYLLGVTVAVLVAILSVFLVKFFLTNRAALQSQLSSTRATIDTLKRRESERELWAKRDAVLTAKMPALGDPDVANKALRELILDTAKKFTVTIDAPTPGLPVSRENYTSLPVRIEAKAPWQAIFDFLRELQAPDRFIAIENCELKVNREDKTQLRATLTVAQWFAPK
jgi:Tfp pilus assembly protein PilO